MLRLCAKPAIMRSTMPPTGSASARNHQQGVPDEAENHEPRQPDSDARPAERDGPEQCAESEARDQQAQAGLVDAIDLPRDIRQHRSNRERRKIEQERQPDDRQQARRAPDMSEPLPQVAPGLMSAPMRLVRPS